MNNRLQWWKTGNRKYLGILGLIWLASALCDRLWFALDNSVPAWDQADYLTGALNYWQALQHPEWFSGEWWTNFWQLSSKIPPFTYIATAIIQHVFGRGTDQATLVLLLFHAILIGSVYGLGVQLFNRRVGLWAAGLTVLLPGLYRYRLEFLLDYPLTAVVTLSFFCLTVWRNQGLISSVKFDGDKGKGNDDCLGGHDNVHNNDGVGFRISTQPTKLIGSRSLQSLLWAIIFGLSLGLALMVKQTALFFLFIPIVWVIVGTIRRRYWGRLVQLIVGLLVSGLVFAPWYRTNWLLILTSGKRATLDSAIAEGDPALNTLEAWLYYGKILPFLVSWVLLLVPIVGLILYWRKKERVWGREREDVFSTQRGAEVNAEGRRGFQKGYGLGALRWDFSCGWLAVFLVGGYLLCSLNVNKDARYILPLLSVFSLVLASGLVLWQGGWGKSVRWGTVGFASVLMVLNLFPLGGGFLTKVLAPRVQHFPYFGQPIPLDQVIDEIIQTSPNLQTTLGVLPSTPEINQHNLNYYGALRDFQVYGRQVGVREKQVEQDARSLSWFVTKTGEQGSVPEAQAAIVEKVEKGGEFQLQKTWDLPDGSLLKLYHRHQPFFQVEKVNRKQSIIGTELDPIVGAGLGTNFRYPPINKQQNPPSSPMNEQQNKPLFNSLSLSVVEGLNKIQLNRVIVPETAPPGLPVPVTYEWTGDWQPLQSGIVLLTWHSLEAGYQYQWLHDHGIAMGNLFPKSTNNRQLSTITNPSPKYQVIEQMAMLPPADIPAGTYTLKATYLNRETGETYPISVPAVQIKIDPKASTTPAPELDLITQFRTLAATLPNGSDSLEAIFEQTGRINQYDPIQDYLVQADLALTHRLKLEPQRLDLAYALALSRVLQVDSHSAIAALKRVVQLDPQNPYAHAYLAFVYLYEWRGRDAQTALKPALSLNPNLPEVQALSGVAALMQGNLVKTWYFIEKLRN
ncbi:dolichyl-phosphate-mannose-protein mannosyltransferase [Coleofasciculus chthonoplastes PCC 7420]|uniref:Dolichyl-phosphate-mannose-protein mannosyltransferase n=1 Tax=Coleofasciculus chthonoplastes PCC 7420 TaxID=118168 RepID=B4VHK8_9CYAN|nr:glycosyltransferase family 39 protein [Coleofasciculus chthonoplastes]EDX78446.1 dolichyl-phosphate-mannose-protein mannosyltransferase [Coleofasciculus chthonoplastes PCC 7420]